MVAGLLGPLAIIVREVSRLRLISPAIGIALEKTIKEYLINGVRAWWLHYRPSIYLI